VAQDTAAVAAGRIADLPGLQAASHAELAEAGDNRLLADLLRLRDRSAPLFRCHGFAFARETWAEHGRILPAAINRDAERLWQPAYRHVINAGPRCGARGSEPSRRCGRQRRRLDPRTLFSRLDSSSDAPALGHSWPVRSGAKLI